MSFSEPFGGIIPGARGAVLAALLRTDAPLTGQQDRSSYLERLSAVAFGASPMPWHDVPQMPEFLDQRTIARQPRKRAR
jgi:hypothetical protein